MEKTVATATINSKDYKTARVIASIKSKSLSKFIGEAVAEKIQRERSCLNELKSL